MFALIFNVDVPVSNSFTGNHSSHSHQCYRSGHNRAIHRRPSFCSSCQSRGSIHNWTGDHLACVNPKCCWSKYHKTGSCEFLRRATTQLYFDTLNPQVRTSTVPKSARRADWLRPLWLLGIVLYILSQLIGSTLALDYMRAGTLTYSLRSSLSDIYPLRICCPPRIYISHL